MRPRALSNKLNKHRHMFMYAHTDPYARVPTHGSTRVYPHMHPRKRTSFIEVKVLTGGVQIYLKSTVNSLQFVDEYSI